MNNINKYLHEIDEYIENNNYNDAFSLCNNILNNIAPNNIEAIFKAGYCAYKLEKYDTAMVNFIKALSLEKSNINKAMYKYYIGRCYDIFDSLDDSLEYFKEAYKLDKSNKYYALWLGITYAKIGANDFNYNVALLYLYKALDIEDSLLYRYAGYCHIQLKNFDTAVEYLEKSLALKEDDYLTRYYLGLAYFSLQIYDKALEHLSESVKLKDDEFDSWISIGLLYKVIDEEVLSEECFEKARNIALEYNNNLDYELDCFIKLLEAQEHEYLNYLNLGICYAKLESYKNAIHYLLESIEINEKYSNENNYLAYYWIGYINYIDSEYEEAVKYLEKSVKLKGYEDNYFILFCLGDSYFKLGNYKKALTNLHKSLELKEDETETYKLMAKAYAELGQKDKHNEYINQYKILLKQEKKHNKNSKDHNKKIADKQLEKMQEDYNNYFKSFSYMDHSKTAVNNKIANNQIYVQKIFEENKITEQDVSYDKTEIENRDIVFYDDYSNSLRIDINNFLIFLFQDIEKSDLYHLYSSSTEKNSYINFNNFNIENFLYYRDIIKNAVRLDLKKNRQMQYVKLIDNNDVEGIKKIVDHIDELFNYTSISILKFMQSYYQKYDIELYFILMRLIETYL